MLHNSSQRNCSSSSQEGAKLGPVGCSRVPLLLLLVLLLLLLLLLLLQLLMNILLNTSLLEDGLRERVVLEISLERESCATR